MRVRVPLHLEGHLHYSLCPCPQIFVLEQQDESLPKRWTLGDPTMHAVVPLNISSNILKVAPKFK